ncbi:large conductance mechanosensitive channel protein MscL [Candidatus Saccharibacteria bacterium]|nr:large conductance mechanosensitive channel protein MscL [Candidatus Saccharibacteria bacterium]MBQ6461164.1 large conductance mechanosensitive channel protein MscL [Candidatus Saccharibacteria bacterium]
MGEKSGKIKEKVSTVKEKDSGFRKEFIEFINRGSVVDLAVGVAVGGAFTAIVNSLVNDIIMPVVGLIGGGVNFRDLKIVIPNFFGGDTEAVIAYGNFIQNVIEFLIIAWVIFMLIKAMNRLNRRKDAKAEKEAKAEKDSKKK